MTSSARVSPLIQTSICVNWLADITQPYLNSWTLMPHSRPKRLLKEQSVNGTPLSWAAWNMNWGDQRGNLTNLNCKLMLTYAITCLKCITRASLKWKKVYYTNTVLDCAKDQGALFSLMNKLFHKTSSSRLPSSLDPALLANNFLDFLTGKISKIPLCIKTGRQGWTRWAGPRLGHLLPISQVSVCFCLRLQLWT